MNLDFHYYGTWWAARIAGFNAPEANEIAWAAQMVDDCTEAFLNECGIPAGDRVITCETLMENAADDTAWLSNVNNTTLSKIRRIWMPFHFLPGNLDIDAVKKVHTGIKSWGTSNYGQRDEPDFNCLCLHNSRLVQLMIDDTRNRFSLVNDATRQSLLYLIGIRMHVLADTWAHEYFTGSPNYWINDVSDISVLNGRGLEVSESKSLRGASSYSIFYLGHGRAGHLPDIRLLRFSFRPHWLGPEFPPIEKDNTVVFFSAFCQMIDAMRSICNNQAFVRKDYIDAANSAQSLNITNADAQNILQTGLGKIPVYQTGKNYTNPQKLIFFEEMAEIQRNLVIQTLKDNHITI